MRSAVIFNLVRVGIVEQSNHGFEDGRAPLPVVLIDGANAATPVAVVLLLMAASPPAPKPRSVCCTP
jgi:hypothetical protein